MEYEDTLTIATPEGVEVTLVLAGAASRFVSALVDFAIQIAALIVLLIVFNTAGPGTDSGGVALAIFSILSFVLFVGYDIFFEVLSSGRTPGKRLNGLRVVKVNGYPVGFVTSAIRNALRAIDVLPGAYLLGAAWILATRKNQRIGDVVAGTLVVRESRARVPVPGWAAAQAGWAAQPASGSDLSAQPVWDTSQITGEELATVRQFLERRGALSGEARSRLAHTLSGRLRPKITGVASDLSSERFLETLVAIKSQGQ